MQNSYIKIQILIKKSDDLLEVRLCKNPLIVVYFISQDKNIYGYSIG